jgi:hypothetical protein
MRRIVWMIFATFVSVPATAGHPGAAQEHASQQQASSQEPPSRDIIVEAIRHERRNIDKMLVPVPSIIGFKRLSEHSQFFARCVKNPRLDRLRAVIDGAPNTPSFERALDTIIRMNPGCYPGYPSFSSPPPAFGACNPRRVEDSLDARMPTLTTCAAPYDRGALLQAAIARYVPDFSLSSAEVSDPAVQARFDAREIPRNRYRLDADHFYFEVAVCMVRLEPGLATELVRSYGDAQFQSQIGQLILVRAKACVGNADHVRVEPRQFALYITDAAYRWEVAARGVESLLPAAG